MNFEHVLKKTMFIATTVSVSTLDYTYIFIIRINTSSHEWIEQSSCHDFAEEQLAREAPSTSTSWFMVPRFIETQLKTHDHALISADLYQLIPHLPGEGC